MMNVHPVDRLAQLKREIAEREAEADQLKKAIIAGEIERNGDEWTATVKGFTRRTILLDDARKALPADVFRQLARVHNLVGVFLIRAGGRRKHRAKIRAAPRRKRPGSRRLAPGPPGRPLPDPCLNDPLPEIMRE